MLHSLFLLLLMGSCSLITCQFYEYYYINKRINWTEAQKYCREHHTDLATVWNTTDRQRLNEKLKNHEAWIGLSNRWRWSMLGVEFKEGEAKWASGEPNNNNEGCVRKDKMKWRDDQCTDCHLFICFNETSKRSHLVREEKTWKEAQSYCREHHTDLASGAQQLDNAFDNETKVWIGLFRDTDTWEWSDGSNFSSINWNGTFQVDASNKKQCVMVDNDKTWKNRECKASKPFICYDVADKVVLVKEQKTWVEALEYCREKHHDLVSIIDPYQQKWVGEKAKGADTDFVWIGLRYTCTLDFWFWISDEVVNYKNWATNGQSDGCDMSGAMDTRGQHKWFRKPDETKYNFLCVTE